MRDLGELCDDLLHFGRQIDGDEELHRIDGRLALLVNHARELARDFNLVNLPRDEQLRVIGLDTDCQSLYRRYGRVRNFVDELPRRLNLTAVYLSGLNNALLQSLEMFLLHFNLRVSCKITRTHQPMKPYPCAARLTDGAGSV